MIVKVKSILMSISRIVAFIFSNTAFYLFQSDMNVRLASNLSNVPLSVTFTLYHFPSPYSHVSGQTHTVNNHFMSIHHDLSN